MICDNSKTSNEHEFNEHENEYENEHEHEHEFNENENENDFNEHGFNEHEYEKLGKIYYTPPYFQSYLHTSQHDRLIKHNINKVNKSLSLLRGIPIGHGS